MSTKKEKKEVKRLCDEINEIAVSMAYIPCRNLQELLCDILKAIGYDEN